MTFDRLSCGGGWIRKISRVSCFCGVPAAPFFIGFLLVCPIAEATDPTEQLSELNHAQWTSREQAPVESLNMTQTKDGLLWISSSNGLYRFDSVHFDRFAMPDGSQPVNGDVSTVFRSSENDLWIGMRFGGAYFIHGNEVTHYGEAQGLPPHSVTQFARQGDGTMWAQTTVGLYRFNGDRWSAVEMSLESPEGVGWSVYVDEHDTVWALGDAGIYFLRTGAGQFARSSLPGGKGIIDRGPDGDAWVCQELHGLRSLVNTDRFISGLALGGSEIGIYSFLVDKDDVLWAVVNPRHAQRLVRIADAANLATRGVPPGAAQNLKSNQPLATEEVSLHLFEDAEGNVWIPSAGGLDRFRSNKLHSATETVPLEEAAVAVDKLGSLWLATDEYLMQFAPHQTAPVIVSHASVGNSASSLLIDDDGSAWIGTENADLVHFYNNQYHAVSLPKNTNVMAVQSVTRDGTGALWIAIAGAGLFRQSGNDWVRNGGLAALPNAIPVYLLRDPNGRIWLGYADNRIATIDADSHVQVLGQNEGLAIGAVLSIAVSGDRVWISGTEGVALYHQGRFVSLKGADGSSFTGTSGIVQGADGGLWMNGGSSITRVPSNELDAFISNEHYRVRFESLTYDDGLRGAAVKLRPLPTAIASGDGKLWFATTKGVFWIDPLQIPRNVRPPPVIIESVAADGARYVAHGDSVRLPLHTTNLEIDYTALSFASPSRVQFRYQLSGVDKTWQDVGNRRQAFYTNVGPGLHTFRMIAANEDGVWNTTGATFGVYIPPEFYQTRWFYALCALAGAALVWQLYRMRLHQVRLRLDERVKERERIARELHDTLLQSAQGLILIFQGFAGQLEKRNPMRERMEIALDQADHLLNEARGRVSELRGIGVEGDLVRAINRSAQEILDGSGIRFSVATTGLPMGLIRSSADEICLIVREAMSNARQHAKAKQVEVKIDFDIRELRIFVRDDGAGIDPAILEAGRTDHYGLRGMRERADRLGARLDVRSNAGSGTEVELIAPARAVYCTANGGLVLRFLSAWWRSRAAQSRRSPES